MTRPWVLATVLVTLISALILGTPRVASAETLASGSAFVVHPDGLLLTCYHVVKDSARIRVTLRGKTYPAVLVSKDEKRDLAVLQINATGLPFLPWVDSRSVELGEEVRAFGFPLASELGDTLKVTRGTISGVEQEAGQPVFQVDSVVNPGNSGGPLLNERGQVVGVVVARFVEAISFGYVVPVTAASPLFRGVAPEAGARAETRLDGPALVRSVAPAIARVTAVPLAETGPLPAPFVRAFPTSRAIPPATPEKPVALAPPVPTKPAAPAELVSKPGPATAFAEPQLFPTGNGGNAPKPEAKPATPTTPAVNGGMPTMTPLVGKAKSPTSPDAGAPAPAGSTARTATDTPLSTVKPGTPADPKAPATPPVTAKTSTPDPKATPEAVKLTAPVPEPAVAKGSIPDPNAVDKAAMEVDNALCRIRATDPPDFPQPVAEPMITESEKSEWIIANPNANRLTIYLRGPERRSIVVEPGKTEKVMLTPGKYEVAAELAVDNVSPFYGIQEFGKGTRYKSRFRVEF